MDEWMNVKQKKGLKGGGAGLLPEAVRLAA